VRLTKFKTTYILMALAIAALSLALGLPASNPHVAQAGVAASAASPTPTAAPSPAETASPADTQASLQVQAGQAEYSVTSDPGGVPSGSIQVNVTNHGAIAHEFVIMQTDNPPNALLYDDTVQKAVEDAPGQQDVGEVGGELPFILPGQTLSGTFDLAPGRYVFLCNIPGHYKSGMYTSFTVGSVSPATNVPTATPSPTVAPIPTAASLPQSGGTQGASTPVWIWLAAGLVVLGVTSPGWVGLITIGLFIGGARR
jgi:uncharacterized cupredoxin-like copper-binding protein